jgi:hypothetical protein
VSKSNIPSAKSCDLYDPGHAVFWLKSIKTIEYPRQLCEVKVLNSQSLVLSIDSKEQLMFNHQISRLAAILTQEEILRAEYCPATGYLYLMHGDRGDRGAFVFSLSETPIGECEIDEGILRI